MEAIVGDNAKGELNLDFLNNFELEDEIYLQMDKLQALASLQTLFNTAERPPSPAQYLYHGLMLEEQLGKLQALLDILFM